MDPDGDSHVDAVRVAALTNCEGLSIHFMAVTMGMYPESCGCCESCVQSAALTNCEGLSIH